MIQPHVELAELMERAAIAAAQGDNSAAHFLTDNGVPTRAIRVPPSREQIADALLDTNTISGAAKRLGYTHSGLVRRMKRLGLDPRRDLGMLLLPRRPPSETEGISLAEAASRRTAQRKKAADAIDDCLKALEAAEGAADHTP